MCRGKLRGARGGDDAFFESFGCLLYARQQRAMRLEKPGRLIEIGGDRLHGIHAFGEQFEIVVFESHAGVERLAHPVLQRRGDEDSAMRELPDSVWQAR